MTDESQSQQQAEQQYPPPQYPPPQYPPPQYPPPQYPPPQYPPNGAQLWMPPGYEIKKKKPFYKRVWFWLLVIVVVVVVIIVASVGSAVNDAVNKSHTVIYKVGGTGRADVTYFSNDGSDHSQSVSKTVRLPWSKTVTIKGDFSDFSVTANSSNFLGKGKLNCSVLVDGKVASTDSSSGSGNLVMCEGSGYDGK